jgi:aminomethyltransferase
MANLPHKTPLDGWHRDHRARMVDFFGWSMPLQYTSIVDEHHATRRAAGIFDISHMGRLRFEGASTAQALDRLATRPATGMAPGRIRYALMTNEAGGILDDVLIYCLRNEAGQVFYQLVVNASNREKILRWIEDQLSDLPEVKCFDETLNTAMIAVQGPSAIRLVAPLVEADISQLKYYRGLITRTCGHRAVVSRTGYTGEDGCEIVIAAEAAREVWEALFGGAEDTGISPAGLGARDTLRLEAAMPLYGQELDESIDPLQAGLEFAVRLDHHDFIGRAALIQRRDAGRERIRVGLELAGRRVPRQHHPVFRSDQQVGEVTSGTFSPSLEKPIAMAYVHPQAADLGESLEIEIRGRREAARVVELPFYRRR